MTDSMHPGERIYRCLRELGVSRAHFAGRSTHEVSAVIAAHPGMVASFSKICGDSGRELALRQVASAVLWVRGDHGSSSNAFQQSDLTAAGAREFVLAGHEDALWSDTAAERSQELAATLLEFWHDLDCAEAPALLDAIPPSGEISGISFQASGHGTPVVLLPLFLAPSQWDPVVDALAARHTVILLSGPELSPVSNIEWRARTGYLRVVHALLQESGLKPGDRVLEVGCGTGALCRSLARRTTGHNPIDAIDISPFLLRAARELSDKERVSGTITYHQGEAEALPFPDATFDIVYSSTMLEEVHADRALAEMVRVLRPGGRVAAVVRAIDLPAWTSLPLSPALRAKVENGEMGGAVSPDGCADRSLGDRLAAAGLTNVIAYPDLGMVSSNTARWFHQAEPAIRARLAPPEQAEWTAALAAATASGAPAWYGPPFHCALGAKSSAQGTSS